MMNNNGHNLCDLSEMLVSYLYGETSAAESEKFKSHLAQCAACAEELAGFGAMLSSLSEGKQEEVAPLTAPVIELPARDIPVVLTDEPVPSWLDAVRAFFTPKTALTPIGLIAGFAAVLICLGLTFAFMTSQGPADKGLVAANSQKEKETTAASPDQPKNTVNIAAIDQPSSPKKNDGKASTETHEKAPKPVREYTSYQPKNNMAKNSVAVTNKHEDVPKPNKQDVKTLNTDIYEDTEDDSLRLADLFAEADI